MGSINSFKELLDYADFSNVYINTKPEVINGDELDINKHDKYSDVKVVDGMNVDNKIIVKPKTQHYLVQVPEDTSFTDSSNNTHSFKKDDLVLLNKFGNKWDYDIAENHQTLSEKYEEVDVRAIKLEKESIDSLKNFKCDLLEKKLSGNFQDFKDDLKEQSTMKIGLIKIGR